ncbi:MAG: hypothetical protein ACNA7K_00015 [Acholeplasmataceae bacterium]|jgi:hypothetical protein
MRTKKSKHCNQVACFEGIQEMKAQQLNIEAFQKAVQSKPYYVTIDQHFLECQSIHLK